MTRHSRRDFITQGMLMAAGGLAMPRFALAATATEQRFVFVILRGALDGLALAPPVGDPDYAALRPGIAVAPTGAEGGVLPMDGLFGLHPACAFLGELWQAQQLTLLHAVATPYRERSHFDGQDVLESGVVRPHATQTGWLNRALEKISGPPRREAGVALGANIPLVMRGPAAVASLSPSRLAMLDDDTLQRLADLYTSDPLLSHRLADALAADAVATAAQGEDKSGEADLVSMAGNARKAVAGQLIETVQAAASFLRRDDGARVAVFDTTGWDTHANEGGAQGGLAARLRALDNALRVLREGLGETWANTVVLVATEFGRTVAENGTRGTDHGTGAAALLLGGAVQGRVVADWPGLGRQALYGGRDLQPTLDLRSVLKSVLHDHLQVPRQHLDQVVFPDSTSAPYLKDLVRA